MARFVGVSHSTLAAREEGQVAAPSLVNPQAARKWHSTLAFLLCAPTCALNPRFAARVSGLASGLALAVRPAESAEVSGAQGRVQRSFLRSG